jgi:hypothetical protein
MIRSAIVSFGLFAAVSAAPARAETCHSIGPTQYARNFSICASSVLPPQGAVQYGPGNLMRDGGAAWCEGAPGGGEGQWIEQRFGGRVRFRTLLIGNGYNRTPVIYANNGRVRRARIDTSDGVSVTVELRDTGAMQRVRLPRWVSAERVRLTILDIYPGRRDPDTCMHSFLADLEEADRSR